MLNSNSKEYPSIPLPPSSVGTLSVGSSTVSSLSPAEGKVWEDRERKNSGSNLRIKFHEYSDFQKFPTANFTGENIIKVSEGSQ